MNSTSPGSRLVRMAARSPARSSTGPAVVRRGAPISAAMMLASVVLPRPGGPKRRTWSSGSPAPRGGRAEEEAGVERRAALAGGADEHPQVVDDLLLADVLVEPMRAQRRLDPEVLRIGDPGEDAVVDGGHTRILRPGEAVQARPQQIVEGGLRLLPAHL